MISIHAPNLVHSKKFVAIFLTWVLCSCVYLVLVNTTLRLLAGYVVLVGQVGMDIIISMLSFKLYQTASKHSLQSIYLMFFLSAIAAITADGVYHIAMNILAVEYFNKVNSFFEIPFIFFLLFQVAAWLKVFFIDYETKNSKKSHYLPYLTLSIFIFFTFVYIIPWKIHYLSRLGIYQLIDTLLEVMGFALSALCLGRSKNNPIRFLSIGYLFIISSDLLIRYVVISGEIPFLNTFESTWIFGQLLMSIGFFYLQRGEIELLPLNSLQSYIAIWFLNIFSLFVLLFLTVNYFTPYKDVTNCLLLVIIPYTLLAIIFSKYFASKILSPLGKLEEVVKEFLMGDASKYSNTLNRLPTAIDDFLLLEKFVHDAFDLYIKNHSIEIEYAKMATQVAHDIKSPMVALNNYFKESIQLDNSEYKVVESSLNRINEIADNLLVQYKKFDMFPSKNNSNAAFLASCLQSLVEEKKLQFKYGRVEIQITVDKVSEKTLVSFNPEGFRRTVSNLINNAVESIENTGVVIVSLQSKIDSLELEIKDNGCGVPDSILKKLEEGSRIQSTNGSGLGLSYAIKSIKEWGARYEIKSHREQGTSFKIIFPIQGTLDQPQEYLDQYFNFNPDLMLVDDNKLVTDTWTIESKKHGKKLVTFNNKNVLMEHIKLFNKSLPVYLDLNLGKDNGIDIAEELYIMGYKNLYITTGYDPRKINKSPWIIEIISKEPPFSKKSIRV